MISKEKREEIREQIKGGKMFFNTELLQALDALDLAENTVKELEEENSKLIECLATPELLELHFTQKEGLEVTMKHWAVKLLAQSFLEAMDNAPNFMTMTIDCTAKKDGSPIKLGVSIVKANGKTPAEKISQLESRLSKARETLGKYADEAEWKTCDIDIGCNVKHCFGKSGQHGYDPAQKCLEEIGGKDA